MFSSGVSPFLDESPEETTSHILKADYSFPSELFPAESASAQQFVSSLLLPDPELRPLGHSTLTLPWLRQVGDNNLERHSRTLYSIFVLDIMNFL